MRTLRQGIFVLLLIIALVSIAMAQALDQVAQKSSLTITASADGERVRITAPSSVVQMHVEVYAAGGERVFDNEIRGGNVFDWRLQDGRAERLLAGEYVCVVTVKNLSGRISQKLGTVNVAEKETRLGPAETSKLTYAQQQTIGPIEDNPSWTIFDEKENPTTTVIAHNGDEGQVIRGRGALSFRLGNFFTGTDKEQMRLTEDGNLGIGTAKPKFKLDVAGPIRAREGLIFKDGSKLNVNDNGVLTLTNSSGNVTPNVVGSGTTNQIAKWTPDGNTLGNSTITESPSTTLSTINTPLVGVNATINNTGSGNMAFSVRGATLAGPGEYPTGLDVAPTFAPSANINLAQGFTAAAFSAPPSGVTITDQFGGNSTIVYNNTSGAVTNGTNFNIASPFPIGALKPTTQTGLRIRNQGISGTATSYGLYVDAQSGSTNNYAAVFAGSGKVGIGTDTPTKKLDVVGDINASGDYNISGNRAFAVTGLDAQGVDTANSNTFAGVGAGTSNIPGGDPQDPYSGHNNNFFGKNAGHANTTGQGNNFFGVGAGKSNTTGTGNSFFGDFAGNVNVRGINNSSFGESAGAYITGKYNTIIGAFADFDPSTSDLQYATAIGAWARVSTSNTVVLGRPDGSDTVIVPGKLQIDTLATAGSTQLCLNGFNRVGTCSSSLRYKTQVQPFLGGLNILTRLRPISFTWKEGGQRDLGLAAEEVNNVEPLLTFRNKQGEIEGVKYNQLSAVLVNAVKEQQQQIAQQQREIDSLKRLVHRRYRRATAGN